MPNGTGLQHGIPKGSPFSVRRSLSSWAYRSQLSHGVLAVGGEVSQFA